MAEKNIEKEDFKGRLRIAGKEINGNDKVAKALGRIKGIGANLSTAFADIIEKEMKIDRNEKIGNLSDDQLSKIEEILYSPQQHGIPAWMFNRLDDPETGADKHLISTDLDFAQKNDIKEEIIMRSYKGVRHMQGLTVRGQRTKTSGRKGLTLGVTRQKVLPAKAGAEVAKKDDKGKKKK
jgi:small subunit ribosomal protein S13